MYDIIKIQWIIEHIGCIERPYSKKYSNSSVYDIMKIQGKIVYFRCTESPNLRKHSNSLNVRYCKDLTKNCVH